MQVHEGGGGVPDAPAGLLKATREWWVRLWRAPLAATYEASDVPALARLASLHDERTRCMQVARKGRLTIGSQGQAVINPLYKHVSVLDAEIRQLEDRFGLSPMARLRLGVQFSEAHKSLDALNAELQSDDADHDEDPRAGFLDARSDARAAGM